ncbi:tRNA dimethylallyltransferase [Gammaproteobacteria bacterium]
MAEGKRPAVVFLMGPTAAGKTALALAIAERFPVRLISVDSAMVYRGLDIGTAKPTPAILQQVPHRLIDICDPVEPYSAARFRSDALAAMAEAHAEGRVPLLVGGTLLYFRALEQGLSRMPAADPEVRTRLAQEAAEQGWARLHDRLATLDPTAASHIHPNDPQRIQRALEVIELTGRTLTDLWETGSEPLPYRVLKLIQAPESREVLHERIQQRFHAMLAQGFEAEVRQLWAQPGMHRDLPALRAVGYRQMIGYLLGEYGTEEMKIRAIAATRQLAKRQ